MKLFQNKKTEEKTTNMVRVGESPLRSFIMGSNKWGKIKQFANSNKLIFFLAIVYVIFHEFFVKYFTLLFVEPFLSHIGSTWYNDIFAIIFLLTAIYLFYRSYRNDSHISNKTLAVSILFLVAIIYYGFSDVWNYTPMFFIPSIAYIDILGLCFLSNIAKRVCWCVRKKGYNPEKKKGFLFDSPIENKDDDRLNREILAKDLADRIKHTRNDKEAFCIGICSEWGQGKTSFLKLIENNLNGEGHKQRLIVHFNPWLNNDEKSIITHFFDELSKELGIYHSELSKELMEYSRILLASQNNYAEKLVGFFENRHDSLRSKRDAINENIKKSNKQIVVFIDDLDRLYSKEILELLRLIRNSASFANTIFIVGYDRNYLISALKESNEYRPDFYLEKIFQLEIVLPKTEKYIVDELKSRIEPSLTEEDKKVFEKLLDPKQSFRPFKYSLLSNIRDINRFINSFLISYKRLGKEVNLHDLMNLVLLRVKYQGVYNLLQKKYESFLETMRSGTLGDGGNYLRFTMSENEQQSNNKKTKLEEYLNAHHSDLGIDKKQIDDVLIYVANIFPSGTLGDILQKESYDSLRSIADPIAIERYFHYHLLDSNLSEVEFSRYRQESEATFFEKIKEWIENGYTQDIINRFDRIEIYHNKEDYEKIIKAIFFLTSIPVPNERGFINFAHKNLLSKLRYRSVKVFYESEDEFKVFVNGVFDTQVAPYLFVSEFTHSILSDISSVGAYPMSEVDKGGSLFILTKEELIEKKRKYFKQYAEETDKIDRNFFFLYHSCGYTKWVKSDSNRHYYPVEVQPTENGNVKEIFIACAERLSDCFLRSNKIIHSALDTLSVGSNEKLFRISQVVFDVWDGWDNFETFLSDVEAKNTNDEQKLKIIKEFKDFFKKFKEAHFTYIKYDFKVIAISDE